MIKKSSLITSFIQSLPIKPTYKAIFILIDLFIIQFILQFFKFIDNNSSYHINNNKNQPNIKNIIKSEPFKKVAFQIMANSNIVVRIRKFRFCIWVLKKRT